MNAPPVVKADADRFPTAGCPIGLALDVLGQKWTLLIIRDALKGARKFSEFQELLQCPRNLLATRLRMLCEHGILHPVRYEVAGQRGRDRYELTQAGRDLAPTLIALFDWGTRHSAAGPAPIAEPSRCPCGGQLHARLQCEAGHDVSVDRIVFSPH